MRDTVRSNHIATLLLLVVVPSPLCFAQKDESVADSHVQPEVSPASFVGCYDLKLSRWWPWSFGEDTVYVTPPRRIRLYPERGTEPWEKGEFLLCDLPSGQGKKPYRGGPSFWRIGANNRIDLVWRDGHTGVTVTLGKSGGKLHGWAHPHFDGPNWIPRIAHAKAKRISCEASP
jgi:hypothetical protein